MRISPMLLFFGMSFALSASTALARTELFVAPTGRDRDDGSWAKPFATLEAARDAIRERRAKNTLPAGEIIVWIRGGNYFRDHAFELTRIDSGAADAPISYRVWNDETARLLGGRVLTHWTPVMDPAVVARLDEAARAEVRQADLRGVGLTNFGQFRSRGFSRGMVPAHLELFFDGQPMTVARYPNEGGWQRIAGIPSGSARNDGHGGQIGALESGFRYDGDRPRRWRTVDEVWVHGYWSWDWANSYERIASLDLEQRLIRTARPHGLYGFRKGQRFYFLNVLEELDQPGEWFLDRRGGVLYFWPPRPPATAEVTVSLLEQPLLSLQDVSHLTFRGLTLEASRGHAVIIRRGASNRIAGCVLRNIGNSAVSIAGGHGHGVVGCDIENTGDGGVEMDGGDRQTLTPGGHFVENCHFQKQGRWSKCYVPAVGVHGVGHRVAYNLIHEHPHCAVLFNGNEHRIEFNEIHHIALETGDVGAIYAGRDWTYRGNRIRHNFIHHTGGVGMGSMGVYMDDCVSGTEIYGNIFYQVTRAAFLGGGRDHRVENNIFVECQPALAIDGRGLDPSPVWHNMVYDFMKKQLAAVPHELYRQRYSAITNVDHFYATTTNGIPPEGNVVARNISVGGQWKQIHWHAREAMVEWRDNYAGPDPGFVAPEKMDFRLKPEASGLKAGFEPIPVEKIGLQDDLFRRELGQRTRARAR